MIQVFRLVDPGRVDRIIAFDELPANLTASVKRGSANGLPRAWLDYLGVKRGDMKALPFYVLDYRTLNKDKESWQEISNYVRRSTDKNVRLLDNLIDMAKPMSVDSYSSLELDPEDVTVIPILKEIEEEEISPIVSELIEKVIPLKTEEPVLVKKMGRPKKVVVTA